MYICEKISIVWIKQWQTRKCMWCSFSAHRFPMSLGGGSSCSRRWPLSMISFPLRRSAARWAIATTSASLMVCLTAAGSAWCGASRFTPNVAKSTEQWRGRAVRGMRRQLAFSLTIYYFKSMETVFDYNITPEEWEYICGMTKEVYLSIIGQESAYQDLAALFYIRGDMKRATEYAEKLPPDVKYDLWRTLTHP